MKIALIIPALNEAETISAVIEKAVKYGTVIVVDDGSTDDTAIIAASKGAIVIKHTQNLGYDKALASGFNKAIDDGFDAVISMDADGQHNPEIITNFIEALSSGADMVLGFRKRPARLAEAIFRLYANYRFGVKDILCGMKAYNTKLLKKYIEIASYPTIGTGITLQAVRNKPYIIQIPIPIFPRKDTPRLGRTLKANYLIFKAMIYDIL